jgi:hypothetical protein
LVVSAVLVADVAAGGVGDWAMSAAATSGTAVSGGLGGGKA